MNSRTLHSLAASSKRVVSALLLCTLGLLNACGGCGDELQKTAVIGGESSGGGGGNLDPVDTGPITAPMAPLPSLEFAFKSAELSWFSVSGASHYQIFEVAEPGQEAVLVGSTNAARFSHTIALHKKVNASYSVRACNRAGCSPRSADLAVNNHLAELTKAIGYLKQSHTSAAQVNFRGSFGWAVAMSGDGKTLAVGAVGEGSNATGVNGNPNSQSAVSSGAVYVFTRALNTSTSAFTWTQQAYIKASNAESMDLFGYAVALSWDGHTLAIGAPREDSGATGVNGNQGNFLCADLFGAELDSGAVYVFGRAFSAGTGTAVWEQQAYIKASNTMDEADFGASVALSSTGNTLAVGAPDDDGAPAIQCVNGVLIFDNPGLNNSVGTAYVFVRIPGSSAPRWLQQSFVNASNADSGDLFGFAVALSGDGNTLAVGAIGEESSARGVNGEQRNNTNDDAGAVYVFVRSLDPGTNTPRWTQQVYLKASNTNSDAYFGYSVALSSNGNTLAVGAILENGGGTGIGGNPADRSAPRSGAVYVFGRTLDPDANTIAWAQQAYLKAANTEANDNFGFTVALSGDGKTLAVAATAESSAATGVHGDQNNNAAAHSGAVYVFNRKSNADNWAEPVYLKPSNTAARQFFGYGVALSENGDTLAVGAFGESSSATGFNGDQRQVAGFELAGAVYLY